MMAALPETDQGYPIRIVNEVRGTVHYVYNGKTREQVIVDLLWGAVRSERQFQDTLDASDAEPFNCVVQITQDAITLRFYCDAIDEDQIAAAREAMEAILGKGGNSHG